jgi:hypothetical protein
LNSLKISIIVLLILLSIQGWTGDYVNLFAVFPVGQVHFSFRGLIGALEGAGYFEVFHASLAFLVLAISIFITILSFRARAKSLIIPSVLGLAVVASAIAGGLLFVFSDFVNNGYSAQMGGSFIGAYALFFILLYYTREPKNAGS